jgi:dihydrofolate reductase
MRRLILKMSLSLDSFACGRNGELDWIFETTDERAAAWTLETLAQAGAHLMGSRTYYDMAAFWPTSNEAYAAPMNDLPKVVFSRKASLAPPSLELTSPAFLDAMRASAEAGEPPIVFAPTKSWTEPTLANGDLAEEIAALKEAPGKDLLAHGGAGFAQSLVATGLIDEYRLLVHPVALGKGRPLFSALSKPLRLRLVNATQFEGPVALVYHPA